MSDLPEGWAWSTVADVLANGFFADGDWVETKDQDPDGEIRLLQLADVGDGFSEIGRVDSSTWKRRNG